MKKTLVALPTSLFPHFLEADQGGKQGGGRKTEARTGSCDCERATAIVIF